MLVQVTSGCQVRSSYIMLFQVISGYVTLGQDMSGCLVIS